MLLDRLRECHDFSTFKTFYHAFIAATRAVTYTMQKEGAHSPGFLDWYRAKQDEMKGDELMRYVHESRVRDFHQGEPAVVATQLEIGFFSPKLADPPPAPDAVAEVGANGINWVIGRGTPQERRVPVQGGGDWKTTVSLVDPPVTHRGIVLAQRDPITIARLALEWLENLLHEAKQQRF